MSGEPFRIDFERSGGFAGVSLTSSVDSTQLDPAQAAELESLLDSVEAAPAEPVSAHGADRFQYDLKVTQGGQEKSFTWGDGNLSEEQRRLVELLTEQARSPQS